MVMEAGPSEINWDNYFNDGNPNVEEEPNPSAQKFYKLLQDSEEPIWNGSTKHTKLSAVTRMLHLKSEHGLSDRGFDAFLKLNKEMLPEDEKLPDTYYSAKKMMMKLGLGYQKIDACNNDCVLFWKENNDLSECPVCGHARYKQTSGNKRKIAWKILRYFPLTPRLQRLYYSSKTAEHMRWHSHVRSKVPDLLRHPADGEAWKEFDYRHPSFAEEVRNVRLGLATDGFNPFGHSSTPYSTWPVIIVPYNLPPDMCMKKQFMFLSLLIPGPTSPGRNIDVYLRPLIDELKNLWEVGAPAFDASLKQNFNLRAAVMWTINDFPAYGMLCGWSTHGRLACPYCMEVSKAFTLKHGGKPSFWGCHRQFLPPNHPFRRQKDKFDKTVERRLETRDRLSGEEVYMCVKDLDMDAVPFGKCGASLKLHGFGKKHNWKKMCIFWELPYWPTLLLRNNLDVMHTEKNVFENVFNTVMNVKGKSKDNLKARRDMQVMGIRRELHPQMVNGKLVLPKAVYTLDKKQIQQVCEWVKLLKLPDGYASNISRCCSLADCRFYGLKSHDCHVSMERFIPIVFRDLLPKPVNEALTELSHFFRDLCSKVLRESDVKILEKNIVETVCKLEKIFPPSFFDSMEHLIIHLAYEARVGGPVQYRWMYPFERYMFDLKKKVRNKARVEGSIAEAYILEELTNFCSLYFETDVDTKMNRLGRNDNSVDTEFDEHLSIFKHLGRALGASSGRYLSEEEYIAATLYALMNCTEVAPFIVEYDEEVLLANPGISDGQLEKLRNNAFPEWFRQRTVHDGVDVRLKLLAAGPSRLVSCHKGYIVNGFRFNTMEVDLTKQTQNSGVLIKGDCYNDSERDFYGQLEEVVELDYYGSGNRLVMFRCKWFDITAGIRVSRHGIVDVNMRSRLGSYEPFVFAAQATQVFYAKAVTRKDPNWHTVIKTKRGFVDDDVFVEMYQEDDAPTVIPLPDNNDVIDEPLCDLGHAGEEVDAEAIRDDDGDDDGDDDDTEEDVDDEEEDDEDQGDEDDDEEEDVLLSINDSD